MKKLFTILLAVAMLASMSVTAFAADDTVTTDGGSKDISVNCKGLIRKVHALHGGIARHSADFRPAGVTLAFAGCVV